MLVAPPNVQAELSNEATPGKIVFEEVVLEAALEAVEAATEATANNSSEAEDHVKKSEAAVEADELQRHSIYIRTVKP